MLLGNRWLFVGYSDRCKTFSDLHSLNIGQHKLMHMLKLDSNAFVTVVPHKFQMILKALRAQVSQQI
jgi:hypothetical protein